MGGSSIGSFGDMTSDGMGIGGGGFGAQVTCCTSPLYPLKTRAHVDPSLFPLAPLPCNVLPSPSVLPLLAAYLPHFAISL
jgi:hypothetical protein